MVKAVADHSILYERGPVGVLLIHGLGGTPVEMRDIARRLAAAGYSAMCCQLAGHCGTEDDLTATGFEDWYDSAVDALHELEKRCSTILVGGLSMGAVLAALVAARQPQRVRGLVMLAPTLTYDGWSIPKYSFLLRLFINTPFGRRYRFEEREPYGLKDERTRAMVAYSMRHGSSAEAGLLATPAMALRELWRLTAKIKPMLPLIRQRTLVVHARHDDIASLDNAITLQRRLGGVVDTMVLEDSYHLVTVDRQRHLVGERVVEFVGRIARDIETERAEPTGWASPATAAKLGAAAAAEAGAVSGALEPPDLVPGLGSAALASVGAGHGS
ncbi:carboxylesterase [Ancylobacter sp. 3268]|uniref:alpha/beta hydrolase n=1 Tax=Ancylobacter sp. 3268 TaxID=2817752 RepID=UPI002857EE92|nr:alpha/beta fold hydrolase [Ancylobacter sp. 3268]MDR6953303.1 carboxylesterase [Ancylobacter sp. 3268]